MQYAFRYEIAKSPKTSVLLIIVHRSYMRGVHVKRKFKYVTGLCHTIGLFHFIGPANGYTRTLRIYSAITSLG